MMGDRQWPDPRGWEALTQAEAERDADLRRRDYSKESRKIADQAVTEGANLRYVERARKALYAAASDIDRLVEALAVAERDRDQAREALERIACNYTPNEANCRLAQEVARAALAEGPQT